MIIAIDFDGTCVTHSYPNVGKDIGAIPVLKELVANGHQLILWTMRSNKELMMAEAWFQFHEIPLYGSNMNPDQWKWTESPKAYAEIYIDDAGIGIPLTFDTNIHVRPFVNWSLVRNLLVARDIISTNLLTPV